MRWTGIAAWRSQWKLVVVSLIAFSQVVLYWRAGESYANALVFACTVWFGLLVLLSDGRDQSASFDSSALSRLPGFSPFLGYLLFGWVLAVLTFVARLYDPLLHFIPLVSVLAFFLVAKAFRAKTFFAALCISLLLPLQVLILRFTPTTLLSVLTADLTSMLNWFFGVQSVAAGTYVHFQNTWIHVNASCSGFNVILLTLSSFVIFYCLFFIEAPPDRLAITKLVSVCIASLAFSFLINAIRILILSLCVVEPAPPLPGLLLNFDFWHDGMGSQIFSLAAISFLAATFDRFVLGEPPTG
jgi:exosortase/archaeosortase family protein